MRMLALAALLLPCGLCMADGALRQDSLGGWRYSLPARYMESTKGEDHGGWHCREYTPGGNTKDDDNLLEICAGPWRATDSTDIVLDHPGMGREEGRWYGYGYGPKTSARELSTQSGWFGWESVVFCGISDRVGYHAAGGECFDGFVVQDSLHVLTAEFSGLPLERVPKRILWVRRILLSARR